MARSASVHEMLSDLLPIFPRSALECVSTMFGKQGRIEEPWCIVEQLQTKFDIILTMGCAGEEYSSVVCTAIQHDALRALVNDDNVTAEYASDALGEFVNTYCALLDDKEEFTARFGVLTQAPPVLCTEGHTLLPFIRGIQGSILFDNHQIFLGYSVRKNIKAASGTLCSSQSRAH